jgi:hypothetical protein
MPRYSKRQATPHMRGVKLTNAQARLLDDYIERHHISHSQAIREFVERGLEDERRGMGVRS